MQQVAARDLRPTIEAALRAENLRLVNENIRLKDRCAHIESERDAALARVESLIQEQGLDFIAPKVLQLTNSEEKILAVLMSRERASRKELHKFLYAQDHHGGADIKIIDVLICRVRAKLKKYGGEVVTVHGRGFELKDSSKQKLWKLREAEQE